MAVTVHLARHGSKGRPFYRVVASRKGAKRDGRFLDILGTYDTNSNPAGIKLKEDKVKKWAAVGAEFTETTRGMVIKTFPGLLEEREKHQRAKIQAHRRKRKERMRAAGKSAKPGKAKKES